MIITGTRIWLSLFDLVKFIPYKLVELFTKSSKKSSGDKSLLIIKLDEIGDYILFRNFFREIRNSRQYKDYKITLCGNKVWQLITEKFDKQNIDEFIWIDKSKFLKDFSYRRKVITNLKGTRYKVVINGSYSRNFYLDDTLVNHSLAENKIGFITDLSSCFFWQKFFSDKYYTELINTESVRFDFYKNRLFFSQITGCEIQIKKPVIENEYLTDDTGLGGKYVVLSMGGRKKYKRWAVNNFVSVAKAILEKLDFKLVLVGSDSDKLYTSEFLSLYGSSNVIDTTGSTNLIELISLLKNAELVLSNDSGIVHISAALNVLTFIILNGTHYGRFSPYPMEMASNVKSFYPPEIMNRIKDEDFLISKYKYRSALDINAIDPEIIIDNFLTTR